MNSGGPVVHVVDDDASFRRSLVRLLGAAGYGVESHACVGEFMARRAPEGRGCVIADLRMPGESGLDLQAALAASGNPLPVIFLTGHGDIPTSVRAIKGGAEDFLTKPVRREELLPVVARALERDAAAAGERVRARRLRERFASLTPREREVFTLIVAGHLNKEIGAALGATERTVKAHRARIMEKLGAQSPAELGRLAAQLGLGAA